MLGLVYRDELYHTETTINVMSLITKITILRRFDVSKCQLCRTSH